MLLALSSLEDVYVRGKTVHFVGDGHRFYGNIECESSVGLHVGNVLETEHDYHGFGRQWELRLEIQADADMSRQGRERILLRFSDKTQAQSVRDAFLQVAGLVAEAKASLARVS